MRLSNFKLNFSEFQQLRNKYAKYTFCCVFVIITQWFWDNKYLLNNFFFTSWELDSQQVKFNKYPLKISPFFFWAKHFANYLASNISHRYSIQRWKNLELLEKLLHCPMHTKHNQMPKTWEAPINNYFEKEWISCLLFKRNKSSEKRI